MTAGLKDLPGAVDLIVLGAGAGGMAAALTAAIHGLDVVLVEKSDRVGGTSAFSAGSVWAPNSRHSPPGHDSFDTALKYLRTVVGNRLDEARATAFLKTAPEMVDFMEDRAGIRFRAYPHHPDYQASLEGATTHGRALEPVPFDASVLGRNFRNLREPLPEFTLFGGMMVNRADIGHLMSATRSLSSLRYVLKLLTRYGYDRLRFSRGTRLVMGNALAGRLYHALLQHGVPVLLSTHAVSLTGTEGTVSGAILSGGGVEREIGARAGVILATGGFSRNPELRRKLLPELLDVASPVVESATGDGLALAGPLGGHFGMPHENNGFWTPVSMRRRSDGSNAVFPHFVLDRGKPGAIAVDPDGRRFVNEATDYHLFGAAMMAALKDTSRNRCYLLCDDDFIGRYGLGMVRPKRIGLRSALRDGYLLSGGSLGELAHKIDVPADVLAATVERHNSFSDSGIDEDFGKGTDAYQQNLGDPEYGPNPCIGKMIRPPFYALEIYPGDIGTSAGLATDDKARVLGSSGEPVEGLYACGNDMESIMSGRYPGPGITLGPALTFGYIAARHAFEKLNHVRQDDRADIK